MSLSTPTIRETLGLGHSEEGSSLEQDHSLCSSLSKHRVEAFDCWTILLRQFAGKCEVIPTGCNRTRSDCFSACRLSKELQNNLFVAASLWHRRSMSSVPRKRTTSNFQVSLEATAAPALIACTNSIDASEAFSLIYLLVSKLVAANLSDIRRCDRVEFQARLDSVVTETTGGHCDGSYSSTMLRAFPQRCLRVWDTAVFSFNPLRLAGDASAATCQISLSSAVSSRNSRLFVSAVAVYLVSPPDAIVDPAEVVVTAANCVDHAPSTRLDLGSNLHRSAAPFMLFPTFQS